MPWFKIDDKLCTHTKWVGTSKGAKALWTTAGSWCSGSSHDGHVPERMLRILEGTPKEARELVEVGLWEVHPDGGWQFHDWADQNPTKDEVEAKREKEREKKRRQRAAGAETRTVDGRFGGRAS